MRKKSIEIVIMIFRIQHDKDLFYRDVRKKEVAGSMILLR